MGRVMSALAGGCGWRGGLGTQAGGGCGARAVGGIVFLNQAACGLVHGRALGNCREHEGVRFVQQGMPYLRYCSTAD